MTRVHFAYLCGCGSWSFLPYVHCEEEGEPTKVIPASLMDEEPVRVPYVPYDGGCLVYPDTYWAAVLAREAGA